MFHRRHPSLARNGNVEVEELTGWGGCCLHWALLWDGLPSSRGQEWERKLSERGVLTPEPRDLSLLPGCPLQGQEWP